MHQKGSIFLDKLKTADITPALKRVANTKNQTNYY